MLCLSLCLCLCLSLSLSLSLFSLLLLCAAAAAGVPPPLLLGVLRRAHQRPVQPVHVREVVAVVVAVGGVVDRVVAGAFWKERNGGCC